MKDLRMCKLCVMKYGFKISDKGKTFETDEEQFNHMEDVHGIPVVREGETAEQAKERCAKKGIVEDRDICQCQECKEQRSQPPAEQPRKPCSKRDKREGE